MSDAAIWAALTSPAGHGRFTAHAHEHAGQWVAIVAWFTGEGDDLGDISYVTLGPFGEEAAARAAAVLWARGEAT